MNDHKWLLSFVHISRTGGARNESVCAGSYWWINVTQAKHLWASQAMAVYRQNIWTKYITFSVFHNPWDRLGFETLLVDYVQMQDDSEPTALELPQMEARVRPDYRELFDAEAIRRASDRFGSDIEKYGYRW